MSNKCILLVEDNPDDTTLIVRALKKGNIANEIVVVQDGLEAIEYLTGKGAYDGRKVSEQPALILLDLKLPKLDGIEVLKRVWAEENLKEVPVIVLTSSTEDRDIIKSYGLGANSYISKPVDFEEFDIASISFVKRF
ncbi:MAG: response regulator [candidate division Zixibacteria bacterium]|nr:response regulator [candidate division Zixibacteria bacterium]